MTLYLSSFLATILAASLAVGQPTAPDTPATAPDEPPTDLPAGAFPAPDLPGALLHPDLPPGTVLIEGDIIVPEALYRVRLLSPYGERGAYGDVNFWPNQTVPFDFVTSGANAVSTARQALAVAAMNEIEERAGVNFRPATPGDTDRIRIQASNSNSSFIGRQGGTQTINIASWNTQIIIVHELYHALGFWHEQSRPDRDTFVVINTGNISTTACGGSCVHNFDRHDTAQTYGPYDFGSFMHYGRADFSSNGSDTITVRAPWNTQWQNQIGQRTGFSYFDGITCRGVYPFANDIWYDPSGGTPTGRTLMEPRSGDLATLMRTAPAGTAVLIRSQGNYNTRGRFTNPVSLRAPLGASLGR